MENVTVKMTETATFVCETSKETKVTWLRDGKVLTPNKKIETASEKQVHKLIIHDATADDKAEYKCTVGDVFTAATLTVEGRLDILLSFWFIWYFEKTWVYHCYFSCIHFAHDKLIHKTC